MLGTMSDEHSGRAGQHPVNPARSPGSTPAAPGAGAAPAHKPPARLVKLTSPLARQLAGRRWFPLWAVVRHRGRRSGKDYAIPVAVIATPSTFVVGLPWGPQTNWVRNVLVAGGCVIRWKAQEYHVTEPRVVGPGVAIAAAKPLQGKLIRRAGIKNFLEVQR